MHDNQIWWIVRGVIGLCIMLSICYLPFALIESGEWVAGVALAVVLYWLLSPKKKKRKYDIYWLLARMYDDKNSNK